MALVHSPLLGTKGRVSMDMMHATDWVPTLYGLAGGNTSKLENLDGFDMWPTLAHREQNPRSEILINIDGNNVALRFQEWKLINTSNVQILVDVVMFSVELSCLVAKEHFEMFSVSFENYCSYRN